MRRVSGWGCVVSVLLLAIVARAQQLEVKLTLAYSVFVVGEPVVLQVDLLNATRGQIEIGGPKATSVLLMEVTKGSVNNELKPFRDIRWSRRLR